MWTKLMIPAAYEAIHEEPKEQHFTIRNCSNVDNAQIPFTREDLSFLLMLPSLLGYLLNSVLLFISISNNSLYF